MMPRVRVTGYLDEGVDSRAVERLLPPSGQWKTANSYDRQCGGNCSPKNSQQSSHYISDTNNIHQSRDKKVRYGPLTAIQHQNEHQNAFRRLDYNLSLKEHNKKDQPVCTYGPSRTHYSDLTTNDGLYTPRSTWKENDSQSDIRFKPTNAVPLDIEPELDFDQDDDYNCCDLNSSPQPLCNEGSKNLCTLGIWAMIIFIIINQFLAHMSMFLHRNDVTVDLKNIDLLTREEKG